MNEYMDPYYDWLNSDYIDENTKDELRRIQDQPREIEDRFYRELEFGTGGLRGIIGAGTNRINIYTVRKATQGLADFLRREGEPAAGGSVAIAFDSRHYSDVFAKETALVLAGNGFKACLFDGLRPTPELSFAVRYLGCVAGVVITASHNPAEYNGYKVYGPDGGQITSEYAGGILECIGKIQSWNQIRVSDEVQAINCGLLQIIGAEVDTEYLNRVKKLALHPELPPSAHDFRVVYTPLHGTGLKLIPRCLGELGYPHFHLVEAQARPDGDFPTVTSPNPEEHKAFTLGIKLMEDLQADILFGTDPDCDRVGVVVPNPQGEYQVLTGNQVGALLVHYILAAQAGGISKEDVIVKTIVTSDLGARIGEACGATVVNTLTGFKYIGAKIEEFEKGKVYRFRFGYEESYGYLAGTFVRDKDAVIAGMLIVEMAAYYKQQGKSLLDVLGELYETYGYYRDDLETFTFKGVAGQEKIGAIMTRVRDFGKLTELFRDLVAVEDYQAGRRIYAGERVAESLTLPVSDVVKINLENGSWVAIRPSGTEPKLKIYYSAVARGADASERLMAELKAKVNRLLFSPEGEKSGGRHEV
jgi:phosphoglucomutase